MPRRPSFLVITLVRSGSRARAEWPCQLALSHFIVGPSRQGKQVVSGRRHEPKRHWASGGGFTSAKPLTSNNMEQRVHGGLRVPFALDHAPLPECQRLLIALSFRRSKQRRAVSSLAPRENYKHMSSIWLLLITVP